MVIVRDISLGIAKPTTRVTVEHRSGTIRFSVIIYYDNNIIITPSGLCARCLFFFRTILASREHVPFRFDSFPIQK